MIGHRKVSKSAKQKARAAVWERCGGKCEGCDARMLYERGEWTSMHTAHIKGGIHRGDWSLENLKGLCLQCHMVGHNPKSVPPKEVIAQCSETTANTQTYSEQ